MRLDYYTIGNSLCNYDNKITLITVSSKKKYKISST